MVISDKIMRLRSISIDNTLCSLDSLISSKKNIFSIKKLAKTNLMSTIESQKQINNNNKKNKLFKPTFSNTSYLNKLSIVKSSSQEIHGNRIDLFRQ